MADRYLIELKCLWTIQSEREAKRKKEVKKWLKLELIRSGQKQKKTTTTLMMQMIIPVNMRLKTSLSLLNEKKNANRDTSAQNKRKTITPPTTTTMITTHLNIVRYARRQCDNGWRLTSVKCEIDNRKVLTLKTSKFRCFFPSFSLSLSRKIYFVTTNLSFSTYCCHSDLWHSTD